MRIKLKLMGTLRAKLPPDAKQGQISIDVNEGATAPAALEQLGIKGGHVHLVMINGEMDPERTRILRDGDEVTVFPPVAGG